MSNTEATDTTGGSGADGSGSDSEDDIFEPILQVVDELYDTRQNYSYEDPFDTMEELISSALQLLDSIPVEIRNLPMYCATYEYLRGKILDFSPSYEKEAEEHLAKAVELNRSLGDAWLSLGNCMRKRGETIAARKCIKLALSEGLHKKELCQLSILERETAQDIDLSGKRTFGRLKSHLSDVYNSTAVRHVENGKVVEGLIEDSIKHAREAVAMDVTNGYSWYCLGNALMNSFFATGARDIIELQESLKAYRNAERDAKMNYNSKLSFNGASVNKYLENYERALSGFEAAAIKDPGLKAVEEIREMIKPFSTMGIFLLTFTKPRELTKSSSVPGLDAVELDPPYRRATLDILQEGVNKAFAIVGKVVFSLTYENRTPLYYILCDSNHQCYILTVYGTRADAIKEGDQVTILDPCYRHQDFGWKGMRYVFETLRVDFLPKQVRVNGQALSPEQTTDTSIFAQFKPL